MSKSKEVMLSIANGALLEVPVRDESRRAINWGAVIDIDPVMPGGLARRFLPTGRGRCYFIVDSIALFDAIEFAGDRTAWSGNKVRNRWHGVVVGKTDEHLILDPQEDGISAVVAARRMRTDPAALARALNYERKNLVERADQITANIEALREKET